MKKTQWKVLALAICIIVTSCVTVTAAGVKKIEVRADKYASKAESVLSDTVGGKPVLSFTDADQWAEYTFDAPETGWYKLTLNVNINGDMAEKFFDVTVNGSVIKTYVFSYTAGFFDDVTRCVQLNQGANTIKVERKTANRNVNDIVYLASMNFENEGAFNQYVAAADYNNSSDSITTPGSAGYGASGLAVLIGAQNKWVEYSVTAPKAGTYTLTVDMATWVANRALYIDVASVRTITYTSIPKTCADGATGNDMYFTFKRFDAGKLELAEGVNTIRIMGSDTMHLDSFKLTYVGSQMGKVMANTFTNKDSTLALSGDALAFDAPSKWAEFTYTAPAAGWYKLSLNATGSGGNYNRFNVAVNGVAAEAYVFAPPAYGTSKTNPVRYFNFNAGANTIRIEQTTSLAVTMSLNYILIENDGSFSQFVPGADYNDSPTSGTISRVGATALGGMSLSALFNSVNARTTYNFTVPKEGLYSLNVDLATWGTNSLFFAFDDPNAPTPNPPRIEYILSATGSGSGDQLYHTYKKVEVGRVYLTQGTHVLSAMVGTSAHINAFYLTYIDTAGNTKTAAQAHTTPNALNTPNYPTRTQTGLTLAPAGEAEYKLNKSAGKYNLVFHMSSTAANEIIVTVNNVPISGTLQNTSGSYADVRFGKVELTGGLNTIKITNAGTAFSFDYFHLERVPSVTLYENSAAPENIIDNLKVGNLVIHADIANSNITAGRVVAVAALYKGATLEKVAMASDITGSIIPINFSVESIDDGDMLKVFILDSLENIKPYSEYYPFITE